VKHVRILGLALAAVFAITVVASSVASAKTPEWGKCVAQAGGKYLDGNCQSKGKGGSFEWKKGASLPNVPFTGHNVGSGGVLRSNFRECAGGTYNFRAVTRKKCEEGGGTVNEGGHASVECESETSTGETSGKDLIKNVAVTFKGCKFVGILPVHSKGAEEGEVRTEPLKGSLGYINAAEHKVGVLLEPATKHGLFANFDIPLLSLEVSVGVGNSKVGAYYTPESKGGWDGIISPITPVNQMTSGYTQVYSTLSEDHPENIPSHFEGKHIELLEDTQFSENEHEQSEMWSQAGEEITNENVPSEPGEIKG
jgi:hypothetical protein